MNGTEQAMATLLNPRRRAVRLPGFAGARLRRGYGKDPRPTGMGDCLLLDCEAGFFAVADSPDRNSSASQRFLLRFVRVLHECIGREAGHAYDAAGFDEICDRLVRRSQELLETLSFRDSCTFTGVLLGRVERDVRAFLLHSGDSFLVRCHRRTGQVSQLTRSNFWMVGKSSRFYQAEAVTVRSDDLFLMATDGFSDLRLPDGTDRDAFISGMFRSCAVDAIPDVILETHDTVGCAADDIAVLTVDPFRMDESFRGRILLGGTTDQEEKDFVMHQDWYDDSYSPLCRDDSILPGLP